MFSPTSERALPLMAMLALAGCGGAPDATANAARIECAMAGSEDFVRDCSLERMASGDGTVLVVGREGAGYRRLLITTDGRGVVAADGVDPASVMIIGDGLIEVAVGGDRFRLSADTDGAP